MGSGPMGRASKGTIIPLKLRKKQVAILPIDDPSISTGGIIIPDTAKQRTDQGIVKYRGADCETVRVGDHVIFSSYSGTKITVEDEGFLYIMEEDDIAAILVDGESIAMVPMFTIERILTDAYPRCNSAAELFEMFKTQVYAEGFEF